ncbi:MAG TPA: hypothetical protein VF746_19230 [Longimicrobium sp.]|jgi:hypothetical protein
MKRTPVVLLSFVAALLVASACTEDEGGAPAKGAAIASGDTFPTDTANPPCALPGVNRLCSFVPHDVIVRILAGYTGFNARDQRHFDTFSWQSFVALNWPASADGAPLPSFTDSTGAPRVWETYLDAAEVYGSGRPTPCNVGPGQKFLGQMAKNGDVVDPDGDFDEAVGGPLADVNVNFALYEKKLNPADVEYLRTHRLNTPEGQYAADTAGKALSFTAGYYQNADSAAGGQVGAIEVKAAWRVLQPERGDDTTRFYTRRAVVYVPARNSATGRDMCLNVQVGLVGLHIVHKTRSFFGDWIWTTFEHEDNAPTCPDSAAPGAQCGADRPRWSFYNAACTGCAVNDSLHLAATRDTTFLWDSVPPYAGRYAVQGRFGNQITRTEPIVPMTDSVNTLWVGRMGATVWRHYRLIGTQWMSGDPRSKLEPVPLVLRNTALESYIPQGSSCLGCHQYAYTLPDTVRKDSVFADFSFLLRMAKPRPASMLPLFSLERGVPNRDQRRPTTVIQPIPGHHLPDSARQR